MLNRTPRRNSTLYLLAPSGGHAGARRHAEGRRRFSEGEARELRCPACGKTYKHAAALAKHSWEHTPAWRVTRRLSISKHQQVQLLEAALILMELQEELPPGHVYGYPDVRKSGEEG